MYRIRMTFPIVVLALLTSACFPLIREDIGRRMIDTGFKSPPPAVLRVGEMAQESGIGSYCWNDVELGASVCADSVGIPTPSEPLLVSSTLKGSLELALPAAPQELALDVFPVDAMVQPASGPEGLLFWEPSEERTRINLPISNRPTFETELEPGHYVLGFFVRWMDVGDVFYGFLVEVE